MTVWLKQSTAAEVALGPFVDSTDGVTAETGLTISQADIRLKKNDGAFAQTNNAAGATHLENGYYEVPLDTTDTNTLGRLRVAVNESGALPVWQDFMVVPANVWDSMFGADLLQVDTREVTGTAQTAGDLKASLNTIDDFIDTEVAAIITTLGTPAGASLAADIAAIEAQTDDIGAAGAGLTAVPWNSAWDAEVQSEVADALDAAVPGSPTANSINERIKTMDDANIPGRLPAALVSGRMDSIASVIATGAVDAAALAADAGTEIAAAVLTAAAADPIDANVEQINTVAITGDGSVTPFGVT